MKNLQEKALLVNLTIRQWCARKYDRSVSQKIEAQHNTRNAGRFNKILIAENELKDIQKISGAVRTFVYKNTLPWGDNGDRLLPATNYFEFITEYNTLTAEFHSTVRKFILQYPDLIEDARKRLNGMFKDADYPSIDTIQAKFDMQLSFMPISSIDDFRLEVGQKEVDKLRTEIEKEVTARITNAAQDIWLRIMSAVSHMVEKLSDKDAIFQSSLVQNISDLVEILPRLNFTQDKSILEIIESMKGLIVDPVLLRNNATLRNKKAEEAKAILDKVSDFLA